MSSTASQLSPWQQHLSLLALAGSLQITADCWALLAAPDGTSRKEHYLPKGEREPETAYRKGLDAARPSGFFRDALRTYAGMLSRGSWISLPTSLSSVLTDVDGRCTDLGVFLAAADLLVLRDGAALVLVLPPRAQLAQRGRPAGGHAPRRSPVPPQAAAGSPLQLPELGAARVLWPAGADHLARACEPAHEC